MTPVSRLTALPAGRKTGVPRMARVGDDIFLVWTEPDGSATKLQAMRISWQAVGTKLLTARCKNLPSDGPERSPPSLTDLELISPKENLLSLKSKLRIVAFLGRLVPSLLAGIAGAGATSKALRHRIGTCDYKGQTSGSLGQRA